MLLVITLLKLMCKLFIVTPIKLPGKGQLKRKVTVFIDRKDLVWLKY